jgi:hypothetical protein
VLPLLLLGWLFGSGSTTALRAPSLCRGLDAADVAAVPGLDDAPFASPDSGSGSGSGCLLLLVLVLLVVVLVALFGDRPGVLPPRRLSALCSLLMSMVTVVSGPAVYFRRYVWICRLRCEFQ